MTEKLSINDAFQIIKDYHIPITLQNHIYSVTKASTLIANKHFKTNKITEEQKYQIIIASLLHDLMKLIEVPDFYEKYAKYKDTTKKAIKFWEQKREQYKQIKEEKHERAAYEELKEIHPKIASIIYAHRFRNVYNLKTTEEKILYYSDKLDEWAKIMPLGKKMILSHLRYQDKLPNKENWLYALNIDKEIFKLEEELLNPIKTKPHECEELNNITLEELFKELNIKWQI
jgi:hypothetical protein